MSRDILLASLDVISGQECELLNPTCMRCPRLRRPQPIGELPLVHQWHLTSCPASAAIHLLLTHGFSVVHLDGPEEEATIVGMSSFSGIDHVLPSPVSSFFTEAAVPRKPRNYRRTFSCLPCRTHKVKYNRAIPCDSCVRNFREVECHRNPALTTSRPGVRSYRPSEERRITTQQGADQIRSTLAQDDPPAIERASTPTVQDQDVSTPVVCLASQQLQPEISSALSVAAYSSLLHVTKQDLPQRVESPSTYRGLPHETPWFTRPTGLFCNLDRVPSSTIHDEAKFWRYALLDMLPAQNQCDILLSFYLENINYIYQCIHVPTFRMSYAEFWATSVEEINLIWLSLLYAILTVSALSFPVDFGELLGFEPGSFSTLSRTYYSASRQCLLAGGAEANPSLTQIQTFILLQLYWYSMEDIETLNA